MKKLLFFLILPFLSGSCEDCTIDPDLALDLLVPSTAIILNEPVDWDYVVKSVEDNSDDCKILNAIASIGKIVIDYFIDQNDPNGNMVYTNSSNVGELNAGDSQTITNNIDVITDPGIYMIMANADDTNVVDERNENNKFFK